MTHPEYTKAAAQYRVIRFLNPFNQERYRVTVDHNSPALTRQVFDTEAEAQAAIQPYVLQNLKWLAVNKAEKLTKGARKQFDYDTWRDSYFLPLRDELYAEYTNGKQY